MRKRMNYAPEFKAKVTRAAIARDATIAELSQRFEVHPNLITQWKRKALESLPDAFATGRERAERLKRGGVSFSLISKR